jgi:hypothetical protein
MSNEWPRLGIHDAQVKTTRVGFGAVMLLLNRYSGTRSCTCRTVHVVASRFALSYQSQN